MGPLRGLVGESSASMSTSLKTSYMLCVLMGSLDPFGVRSVCGCLGAVGGLPPAFDAADFSSAMHVSSVCV